MSRTDARPHYGTYRRVRKDGYVDLWAPDHPMARPDGYVLEHRMVAYDAGVLTESELHVHHKNGDKQDNRLENLEVHDASSHQRVHLERDGVIRNQHGEWKVGEGRARQAEEYKASLGQRFCEVCGEDITSLRADATVCGTNCRVRRYRGRAKTP